MKEVGEWLGQAIKYRRLVSLSAAEQTLRQAKDKLQGLPIQLQPIPLKTAIPLLEACSLEESQK